MTGRWRFLLTVLGLLTATGMKGDSTTVCLLEADVVPGRVMPTNRFLRGANPEGRAIENTAMGRLKVAFLHAGDPQAVRATTGLGLMRVAMSRQMGAPWGAFLLQGAPVAGLSPRLSVDYEMQLGVTTGWRNFRDYDDNHVLGTSTNVYFGGDLFVRWMLSPRWSLTFGVAYAHYSNANLDMPNEGLNTLGLRVTSAYCFNPSPVVGRASVLSARTVAKDRRWFTDVLAYGGWMKKSAFREAFYAAGGLSVSPCYRLNEAVAVGPSVDLLFDGATHLATPAPRPWHDQVAIGLQAKAELTMPLIRVSAGAGQCVGGYAAFYETVAMKVDVARGAFFHLGYCLYNYKFPNHLMVGMGCRL